MADALQSLEKGRQFLDEMATGTDREPLVKISVEDFLNKALPAREAVLSPWLLTQSLNMIHAWRGIGKTHVALGIAYAVASGGTFLGWSAPKPRKVLYIDGEMPATALQERLARITMAASVEPVADFLHLVTPDLQRGAMPDLATAEGQDAVNAILDDTELVVLDNLSCLARSGGRENDAESWLPVAQWALELRTRGRSVLFIHHSAKGGQQRGTSKREDLLDTVLRLKEPTDYRHGEGARFEVHYEKARNLHGEATRPIEAQLLGEDASGQARWTFEPVEETTFDRVVQLANEGRSCADIAKELGCNRSTAFRHRSRAAAEGLIRKAADKPIRGKR